VGLGYGKGDVVDKCHLDPRLAKGKRPGEGDMGKLFCEALFRENIILAPTTWATIDTRIVFLIEEATRWESHYGPLDKKPRLVPAIAQVLYGPAENGTRPTSLNAKLLVDAHQRRVCGQCEQ